MYANLNTGAIHVNASFEEQVQLAVKHGFPGCDVDLHAAEQLGIQQTKDLFDSNGLSMGGWGLPVEFRQGEKTFRADLSRLPRWANLAANLGCTRCMTWVPSWSDERPFAAQFREMQARFRDCAVVLKDNGCSLGLEFLGPKTLRDGHAHEFIYTLTGMLEMAEAVGTGNVGLLLDAWHWYASGGDLDQLGQLKNEQVVYVHISDAPRDVAFEDLIDNKRELPMETGVIDLPGFLGRLAAIGYDGPVTTEPFYPALGEMPPDEAIQRVKRGMEKAWRAAGLPW
jgi:sugar phosphate isomerase/epimerase